VRAVVEGLLLQGCGFHNNVLSRLQADSPSMELLPPCVIAFIDKVSSILTIRSLALVLCRVISWLTRTILCYCSQNEADPYPCPQAGIQVPVYSTTAREEVVCQLVLPSQGDADLWVLSGAALFLSDLK